MRAIWRAGFALILAVAGAAPALAAVRSIETLSSRADRSGVLLDLLSNSGAK